MPDSRLNHYPAWPSGLRAYAWPLIGLLMWTWVPGFCREVGLALLDLEPPQRSSCQASPLLFPLFQ